MNGLMRKSALAKRRMPEVEYSRGCHSYITSYVVLGLDMRMPGFLENFSFCTGTV